MEPKVVIILIGAPGSGKTTWGKFYAESRCIVRLCPDEFRAKLGTSEDDQSVSAEAFGLTRAGMENVLSQNKSVMIDATNMSKKRRKQFLDIAHKYNAKTMAIIFEADKKTLVDRNINRGKAGGSNVPEEIIDRMLENYQRPDETEFDIIQYISKL